MIFEVQQNIVNIITNKWFIRKLVKMEVSEPPGVIF